MKQKLIVTVLAIFTLLNMALGQSDLFSYRINRPTLDNMGQQKYQQVISLYDSLKVYFIEFNTMANSLDSGMLLIPLPSLSSSSILFETSFIRYESEGDYEWHGVLPLHDSTNDFIGNAVIISDSLGKYGQINVDSNIYIINSLNDSVWTISTSESIRSDSFCEVDRVFSNYQLDSLSRINQERSFLICKSRILILYTDAAESELFDIVSRANISYHLTRQALRNSNIDPENLSVELAGIVKLDNFSEGLNTINQINGLLRSDTAVESLRASYRADIVVLLVTVTNFNGTLGITGGNSDAVYCTVRARFANDGFIFQHEMGHAFFGNHETCDTDEHGVVCSDQNFLGYEHAHTWTWKKWSLGKIHRSKTLIFSGEAGDRILNYSNPTVYSQNGFTGITDMRDNARAMEHWGCAVSSFDVADDGLFGVISGPDKVCPCELVEVEILAQGGSPNYTNINLYLFEWSYSYDGINYLTLNDNSSAVSIEIPCDGSPHNLIYPKELYIKVKITDINGFSFISYKRIVVVNVLDEEYPCTIFPRSINISHSFQIDIVPNPTSQNVYLQVNSDSDDILHFTIFNYYGTLIHHFESKVQQGEGVIEINSSYILPGVYYIVCTSALNGQFETKKLIVL